jgi:uncharacterized membrane protein YdfJ with MMPL/SSD domain
VFERLAVLAQRRRWLVVALTFVFVAISGAVGGQVSTLLTSGAKSFEDSSYESVQARQILEQAAGVSPEVGLVALIDTRAPVGSAEARAKVNNVVAIIRDDPAVGRVFTYYNTRQRSFVSNDGGSTYAAVAYKPISDDEAQDAAKRMRDRFEDDPDVQLGGASIASIELDHQSTSDLARAEGIAIPLLLILSFLVFRGVVAALLPVIAGVVAILGSFLALRIAASFTSLSIFALNLITGLGLGLAIDYSLFVVSRYREALLRHGPGLDAMREVLTTAGRTVVFSALTVAAAMASLMVFPQQFLYSMGLGGVFVALIAAVAGIVVLPAILALVGNRVNALSPKRWRRGLEQTASGEARGFWYRLSYGVMRRAPLVAASTAALLIALGIPFFGVKFIGVDASILPSSASARQVDDILTTEFPPNRTTPTYLAIRAPSSEGGDLFAYTGALRQLPGVADVIGPIPVDSGTWRIDVVSEHNALTGESQDIVRDIRELPPFDIHVGGQTAGFIDLEHSLGSRLPIALALLCATTLILLFLMTGSVVLPIKTFIMNLLTLSATFGILVFIFQDGRLEGLLGYTSQGALNATQPILIAAVGFALSTDYAVFLLTRIKEARSSGLPNEEAVAVGLQRTGRIVTAAALLFCVAIGAFATSKIILLKEIGVGMALAVIIDATIVRALLVPSLMRMLGDWNWWAPPTLRRIYERFGMREASASPPTV